MHGVPIHFIVYDLLAIRRPELFPPVMPGVVQRWLKDISECADGLVCISKAVADDLLEWLDEFQPRRLRPLSVGYFHLGADVNAAIEKAQIESSNEELLNSINSQPTVLMVGTVEPRKGHSLALAAMEQLWDRGQNLNLVVIGQQGWNIDSLANKFLEHPELGRRFFWFSHASDESLLSFYRSSTVLLAASQGEGFGLPLVEAALNGLPVIARDIPVFREVVGANAFYFPADCSADMLAQRVEDWFILHEKGLAPRPERFDWLTWEQSAQMLTEAVKGQSVYETWRPLAGY
jgi:glycosyltransferase involved in cell wall biosynthesis